MILEDSSKTLILRNLLPYLRPHFKKILGFFFNGMSISLLFQLEIPKHQMDNIYLNSMISAVSISQTLMCCQIEHLLERPILARQAFQTGFWVMPMLLVLGTLSEQEVSSCESNSLLVFSHIYPWATLCHHSLKPKSNRLEAIRRFWNEKNNFFSLK